MTDYMVFTDAGASLPEDLRKKYDIGGVNMEYVLGQDTISVSPGEENCEEICEKFYEALRDRIDVSTSQITPYTYTELFTPILKEGKDILYVCFSSGMSQTWNNASMALEELSEAFPERKIRFVDTFSAAAGQAIFVVQAAINAEKGMSLEENAAWLEANAQRMNHWFIVDDLDFLKRGGRVSAAAAFLGGKLQIKPLLTILPDGSLEVVEKIRGRKKAIKGLVDRFTDKNGFGDAAPIILLDHAGCREEAEALAETLRAMVPEGTEIGITGLSPIIGAHCGPGMMSVCFYGKERE